MKGLSRAALMALFWFPVVPALAQHAEGGKAEEHGEAQHGGGMELWKWANFALLAGGIGYAVRKNAGPFFARRNREIRKSMIEADELRAEADAKLSEIDTRLANLEAEIASLRQEAQREDSAEGERLREETAVEIAKIQAHAEQEIAATTKSALLELKRYSAALALELAEQKIRARMTAETEDLLIRSFVENLAQPAWRVQST